MIRKLGLHIHMEQVLFVSSRKGFETTAEAINLMADKIDELVSEVNRVNQQIDNIKKEISNDS
jgi:hypothetical protein